MIHYIEYNFKDLIIWYNFRIGFEIDDAWQ